MRKQRFLSALCAAVMAVSAIPMMTASAANVGDKLTVQGGQTQHKGNCDGFSYEIWLDNTGGSGSMTLGKGATFKAEWSASVSRGNFLARRGIDFGSQKKATDYDYIGMDYAANYQQTGSASGNSRLCVYGWFENRGAQGNPPLVEYYIIEDWVDWCPDAQGTMVTIDGAQYKIFQMDHTGPDIHGGSSTFKQYYSVRQSKRTSGHITVSEHFKAWEKQGWGIGLLYEVALNAEGWQSSGVADVTKLNVYTTKPVGDEEPESDIPVTVTPSEPEVAYTAPSGSGSGVSDGFEKAGTDWAGRGDSVSIGMSSEMAHSGSNSLYVTDRQYSWNGATIASNELEAGKSYNISAFAAYKNEAFDSEGFTIGLQYDDASGKTNYTDIVDAQATSGKWVELNKDFDVPSGATNISLYFQTTYTENDTAKDRVSFFIDDVKLTAAGSQQQTVEPEDDPEPQQTEPKQDETEPAVQPAVQLLAGDVDGNGKLEIADAIMLAQFNAELVSLSNQGLANANVDGKDGVDAGDLSALLILLAKS